MNSSFLPNNEKLFRMADGVWKELTFTKSPLGRGSKINVDGKIIPNISTVIETNQKIGNLILDFYETDTDLQKPECCDRYKKSFRSGELEIILINTFFTRRANVYLFLQFNHTTKKIRIFAYGIDHLNHSAVCFGTSLSNISRDRLTEHISECLMGKGTNLLSGKKYSNELKRCLNNISSIDMLFLTF